MWYIQKKKEFKKYSKLLVETSFSTVPFVIVMLYMDGPWKMKIKWRSKIISEEILILTVMDEETLWIEIIQIQDHRDETSSKDFDLNWLCCYPLPTTVLYDNFN